MNPAYGRSAAHLARAALEQLHARIGEGWFPTGPPTAWPAQKHEGAVMQQRAGGTWALSGSLVSAYHPSSRCRRQVAVPDGHVAPPEGKVMKLTSHYCNPAALAFACPKCGARPGTNCFGDTAAPEGRYQHFIHAARVRLLDMPSTREEWEERAEQIRANVR